MAASTTMADVLRAPRPVGLTAPDRPVDRPAAVARPATRTVEARRPVHLAVVVGLSAGAYAVSLAGVTALQAATNRDLADANAPAVDTLATLTAEHDRLEARLSAAGTAYGTAAAAYSDITDQLVALEARLGKLASQVKKVEGSVSWVPPAVHMPSVSRAAPAKAAPPASNGSSGASGH
jgi:hypothetical protein